MNNKLFKGTLILTITSFAAKFICFYYRILLIREIGTVNTGLFQMVFPIIGFFVSISSGGIEIAIVKQQNIKNAFIYVTTMFSLVILIYTTTVFKVFPSVIPSVYDINSKIIILLLIGIYSIKGLLFGYFLSNERVVINGISTFFEAILRVVFLIILNTFCLCDKISSPIYSLLLSEGICQFFVLIYFIKSIKKQGFLINQKTDKLLDFYTTALPIAGTRILFASLHSIEALFIPRLFIKSGLSENDSLTIYGIIFATALPIILFPTTITTSLSTVLLPHSHKMYENKEFIALSNSIQKVLDFCTSIGVFSIAFFLSYGHQLASLLFGNHQTGMYVLKLSLLCPFIYIETTISGILNGLGQSTHTSFYNCLIGLLRILISFILIPFTGITGFIISLLLSEFLLVLLTTRRLHKLCAYYFNVFYVIIKNIFICLLSFSFSSIGAIANHILHTNNIVSLYISTALFTITYTTCIYNKYRKTP